MDRRLIGPITEFRRSLCRVDSKSTPARIAVLTAGVLSAALMAAAPALADPSTDPSTDASTNAFINSLGSAGVGMVDPSQAAELGQSVCPMLSQPGQDMADTAAQVADAGGMSLGPATMFTGLAISAFCPGAMSAMANGESPIPLGLLGGLSGFGS
jgi:hypothetical protein